MHGVARLADLIDFAVGAGGPRYHLESLRCARAFLVGESCRFACSRQLFSRFTTAF
jgi:hypothetical protein